MAVPIRIDDVVKYFGSVHAVDHVSIEIEPGEIFFLLGPSGCGKTTLLRTIAGFHDVDSGRIFIGDRDVTSLPPHKRDTGMVFQSYALWPHMTVAENVAFGLDIRRVPKAEAAARVARALDAVHMADRASYKPNMLSGGQQQRVALARALVIEPQCLLLDEPLSNLDAKLRIEMRTEIRRICKERGLTAIYVTHDQKEALSIADRLAVLNGGHVEQVGAPAEVYRRPKNRFVAGFIGEANFLDGKVSAIDAAAVTVETALGKVVADAANVMREAAPKVGDAVTLCVRPESVRVLPAGEAGENAFAATVSRFSYQGDVAQSVLAAGSLSFSAVELGGAATVSQSGAKVIAQFPRAQIVVL
jgi:iron(III) transport system ATP-binding protein